MISILMGAAKFLAPSVVGLFAGDKGEQVAKEVLKVAQNVTGIMDPEQAVAALNSDAALGDAFQKQVQANEHALKKLAFADKRDARAMYKQKNAMADKIANRIMTWNLPMLAVFIVANVVVAMYVKESGVAQLLGNLMGAACTSLWQERRTIIEFFYGAGLGGDAQAMARPEED